MDSCKIESCKKPCGCSEVSLEEALISTISYFVSNKVDDLRSQNEEKLERYWSHRENNHSYDEHNKCANDRYIYERSEVFQNDLRQFLENEEFLPLFALQRKPNLSDILYKRLKDWASKENNLTRNLCEEFSFQEEEE